MQLSNNSPATSPIANFPSGNHFYSDGVAILNEMSVNIKKLPKQRRYSPFFKTFAMGLLLISYPCYTYLWSKLPFPLRRLLMKNFGTSLSFEYQKLTDIEAINSITNKYREKENLSDSEVIDIVLAVDAISFNPVLKVDQNGTVYGTTKEEVIDNLELEHLSNDFAAFEKFMKKIKNVIITDAFVFQAQPIYANYPSFVVHVFPTTQGKWTDREVELLFEIKKKLEKQNFKIISLAFDGDNIYQKVHRNFYEFIWCLFRKN